MHLSVGNNNNNNNYYYYYYYYYYPLDVCRLTDPDSFFDLRKSLIILPDYIFSSQSITKTYLYNFDPLKPHFYIVKLGFTGVYIIFLISA